MTILRAMEELKHLNIIKQGIAGKTGRKKLYAPIEKKNYYRIGKEYLVNPVNTSFYVDDIPDGITIYKAGETALSEQTMLAEPANEVFATYGKRTSCDRERLLCNYDKSTRKCISCILCYYIV